MRGPAGKRKTNEGLLRHLVRQVSELARRMDEAHIAEMIELHRNPRRALLLQLGGGIFRGVGIGIGFTLITGAIIYLLTQLVALNLPLISGIIADIVRIVELELNVGP